MRIVVDTNILVASLFRGGSGELVEHWLSGRLTLCLSREIYKEYANILCRFMFKKDPVERIMRALDGSAHCLYAVSPVRGTWVPEDPEDDKFVGCALSLGADFIVSSDGHLRKLGRVEGIGIVPPARVNALL
jgi:putative PIN family toxin of toxin-antitoxin system